MDNLTEFIKLAKKAIIETDTKRPVTVYNQIISEIKRTIVRHKANIGYELDVQRENSVPDFTQWKRMIKLQGSLYRLLGRIEIRKIIRENTIPLKKNSPMFLNVD